MTFNCMSSFIRAQIGYRRGSIFEAGRGKLPPKRRPYPQCDMKHCLMNLKNWHIGAKGSVVAFTIRHSAFPAGALLRTSLEAHDAPPDAPVDWGGDMPRPPHTRPRSPLDTYIWGHCPILQIFFPEPRLHSYIMCDENFKAILVKLKFSQTRYRALGPELIPVYRQSAIPGLQWLQLQFSIVFTGSCLMWQFNRYDH